MLALIRLTLFHTEYGTPLGLGAQVGKDLAIASLTLSLARGTSEGSCVRRPLCSRGSLGGKKRSNNALLIVTGLEAPGREGNLELFLGAKNCLAVQMLFGEVLERKSAQ